MKLLSHVQSEQNGEKDKTIFKIFLCYSALIYSPLFSEIQTYPGPIHGRKQ